MQEDSKTKFSSLQYPSVSVCVEYTYKKYIDDELTSANMTMEQVENLVQSKVWKRNETFYFVNHKTSARADYPCMTRSDSSDPGRPCTFPFQYSAYSNKRNGVTFYNCSNIVSQEPWCYTKVDNQSHHCEFRKIELGTKFIFVVSVMTDLKYWGLCNSKEKCCIKVFL